MSIGFDSSIAMPFDGGIIAMAYPVKIYVSIDSGAEKPFCKVLNFVNRGDINVYIQRIVRDGFFVEGERTQHIIPPHRIYEVWYEVVDEGVERHAELSVE